ncbi:alveolin domain containing intermediate filament imc12 [Cystoisospora suis]|uniref:Alveolin domain containing intermediate filament imc12 n=1 Tax=Cystoisospora suis TaxID=483139 RepID=A0A2C6L3Y1_9APIC|nr:alveolin domain containing intermediate filament imc12 [Cystoisospora suis]
MSTEVTQAEQTGTPSGGAAVVERMASVTAPTQGVVGVGDEVPVRQNTLSGHEYREVRQMNSVEVPEIHFQYVDKHVEVPAPYELPIIMPRQVPVQQIVDRNIPKPVEVRTTHNYRMPRIKPKYYDVHVPIYVPRYVEVPVPSHFLALKKENAAGEPTTFPSSVELGPPLEHVQFAAVMDEKDENEVYACIPEREERRGDLLISIVDVEDEEEEDRDAPFRFSGSSVDKLGYDKVPGVSEGVVNTGMKLAPVNKSAPEPLVGKQEVKEIMTIDGLGSMAPGHDSVSGLPSVVLGTSSMMVMPSQHTQTLGEGGEPVVLVAPPFSGEGRSADEGSILPTSSAPSVSASVVMLEATA